MIARVWLSTGSSNIPTGPAHNVAPDVSRISRSGAGRKPFWWNV